MVDKQKEIEEMAKDLHKTRAVSAMCDGKDCNHCKHAELKRFDDYTCIDLDLAEELYNAGYRKIPENAVVLTREEYETYTFIKRKWGNQDAIKWSELVDGLYEFAREFSKETAEKFAQALENRLDSIDTILHEDNEEEYLSANELGELIDEIAKGITEGKE